MTEIKPMPFLKWPGGKRQLLPELLKRVPKTYHSYYEPFLGGGALLFALSPRAAIVSDINPVLIHSYRSLLHEPDMVNNALRFYDDSLRHPIYGGQPFYTELRKQFNRKIREHAYDTDLAAMLIFLNKHGFNGLYRVNAKGKYNVPWNHSLAPSTSADILRADFLYLRNLDLRLECMDFAEAVADAGEGDFVFFDSPYAEPADKPSFTAYTAYGFPNSEHVRLSVIFKELDKRGCHLMLTNHDTPFIRRLYDGYSIESVAVHRSINRDGANRHGVEVIITNY